MDSDDEFPAYLESTLLLSPVMERSLKRLKRAADRSTPLSALPEYLLRSPKSPTLDCEALGNVDESFDGVSDLGDEVVGVSAVEESRSDSEETIGARSVDAVDADTSSVALSVDTDPNSIALSVDSESLREFEIREEIPVNKLKSKESTRKMETVPKYLSGKERRDRKAKLQADAQRSLRETRDASFKPTATVQKSISSLLEKIRQRKRDISTKYTDGRNSSIKCDAGQEMNMTLDDMDSPLRKRSKGCLNKSEPTLNESEETVMGEDLKNTTQTALDEIQTLTRNPESYGSQDEHVDETPSCRREVLPRSPPAMKLKHDSTSDDSCSDEESNDKENVDPLLEPLPVKDFSAKAFLDDEAEEEDDSDNDKGRFNDDDEDDENADSDEFDDMITNTFQEKSSDKEVRHQLHQIWLEQHDNAGTEKLLRKFKCGSVREMNSSEKDYQGNEDETLPDVEQEIQVTTNMVRINLKKAKEMIPHEFTDKDDVYISSEDEEFERRPAKESITAGDCRLEMPVMDAGIKGFLGQIKRLNVVEDSKRKAKVSNYSNASDGIHNLATFKSFIGREFKSNLPSFQKPGSGAVRSYIFERDTRTGRTPSAEPENPRDGKEKAIRKNPTKHYSSQHILSSQKTQKSSMPTSGLPLGEILKKITSSEVSKPPLSDSGYVKAVYESFKLVKYHGKRSVSMRRTT